MTNCNFFNGASSIQVGQKVYVHNFSPAWGEHSALRTVTKIEGDKVYVEGMQTHFRASTGRQIYLNRTLGDSFLFTSLEAFKYFEQNQLLQPLLKNRYNAIYHDRNEAFVLLNGREARA